MSKTVERFLGCGLPEGGFARIRCDTCRSEYLVAFSCKQRGFCPSCSAKRAVPWTEFVREQVIRPVPHRHLVFALPKVLRLPTVRSEKGNAYKVLDLDLEGVFARLRQVHVSPE